MYYGQKVRWVREELRMTRKELAKILEISPKSLTNVENSKKNTPRLSRSKEMKLATLGNKSPLWFYGDNDDLLEIKEDEDTMFYRLFSHAHPTVSKEDVSEMIEFLRKVRSRE